ncbi:bactoprenol glucosyl transferase [candidate division WOR-1 bacterium RIFOXYC2_FULL_37_10]|uniref:Bactoprenol glucosyl transferase n=1 Tax=candidate division WOR-1 bacterium RIFOXYB2_FULL_37_13 TaxID=1802579 RepID=A0A1F4SQ77_UNCSA|nr:MAG: bactoprenol glucosyl transferase [candidate division WOR-1 bacterium RIFOXYB2_FULL_37_13]OGC34220.1 MAG: bactoprenol glucosyl transferase [candidate division WOR-1 bacterium RIFOXYC2_FULL_37_10]
MSIRQELVIIVPCYNEQEVLSHFYSEINRVTKQLIDLHCIFLFIDDGSQDNTLQLLKSMKKYDDRVNYISFSRNFGKEAAIFAGLQNAKGDFIAVIDVDLQDPPELLKIMYKNIMEDGYDVVIARRATRKKEPILRSFFTKMFYRLMNKLSDVPIIDGVRDFRLMTRQVVNAVLQMSEYNRFSKGIFSWVGFKTKYISYENVERAAGQTKWSLWQLFVYSISGITSFSSKPLLISSWLGLVASFFSFIFIITIIVRTIAFGDPVSGWPSTIAIILFMGGIQLLSIGLLGEYMSKTYAEVKKRPIYLAKEKSFDNNIEKGKS